jgi:hypothetical protein
MKRTTTTMTLRLDATLAAELRAFVKDNAGRPLYLHLSSFANEALAQHLAAMRRKAEEARGI